MGEVGELLELLHGARRRYRTVRGVLRQRSSLRLTQEAHERWQAQLRAAGHAVGSSYAMLFAAGDGPAGELPDRHELVVRFWSEPPARLREETETLAPEPFEHVVVRDGERWWTYSPGWGAVSNVGAGAEAERTSPGGGELWGQLLDPAAWIPVLELEPGEDVEVLGRPALRVRATPRAPLWGDAFPFHGQLPVGADEYRLAVDRERGVLLRATALLDGEELSAGEFQELAFDEELTPETFVFEPPPGEEIRAPDVGPSEAVTIEEAAARASFPVFLIPELPEGRWELHAVYVPPSERPPMREAVHLAYHRPDAPHHLIVTQSPAVGGPTQAVEYEPAVEPETVERDGLPFAVHRPPRRQRMPLTVSFERGGTALQLSSPTLDEAVLLDLAASMEQVGEDGSADQRAR